MSEQRGCCASHRTGVIRGRQEHHLDGLHGCLVSRRLESATLDAEGGGQCG